MNSLIFAGLFTPFVYAENALWPDLSKQPTQSKVMQETADQKAEGKAFDTSKDVALIVSIEDYAHLPDIPNAQYNGLDWYRYFNQTRKIPADKILWLDDTTATSTEIRKSVVELSMLTR